VSLPPAYLLCAPPPETLICGFLSWRLLSLFKRTAAAAAPTNTSNSTHVSLSDLQAAFLSQINISREI
jgi:hypothetical protein